MRVFTSLVVAVVFAFTLGVSRQASAIPDVAFASGIRMPTECSLDAGTGALDCDATASTILTFTVIITVSSEGMQAYSFGAKWDDDGQAELSSVSGKQAYDATLYASRLPPIVTAAFSPTNGARSAVPGITQSTGSNPGFLPSWSAIGSAPESAGYSGAVLDGASYRAGRISVTVSTGNAGSVLQLGFLRPEQGLLRSCRRRRARPQLQHRQHQHGTRTRSCSFSPGRTRRDWVPGRSEPPLPLSQGETKRTAKVLFKGPGELRFAGAFAFRDSTTRSPLAPHGGLQTRTDREQEGAGRHPPRFGLV